MLDADTFRALALALPMAEEGRHQGHPDFAVSGRIFATLDADGVQAMVRLAPEQQKKALQWSPCFRPAAGAWGRQGCTMVELSAADRAMTTELLRMAWERAMSEPRRGR
jgi:hypothetical protein